MPYPKQRYFHKRKKPRGPRVNHYINASEVQVISNEGKNLGVIKTKEAIGIAKEEGLDLIEISPNAKPPVCKIIDIGKYKYDLQKKANKSKKNQRISHLKEIKLRPGTDVHDYNFKIKNSIKFLKKGDKVKFTVRFKGREMEHVNLGKDLMDRIKKDTNESGKVETEPQFEGRQMIMIVQPL